jgi:hypothetical protein
MCKLLYVFLNNSEDDPLLVKQYTAINTADNIVVLTVLYSFRVSDDNGIWHQDILYFFWPCRL